MKNNFSVRVVSEADKELKQALDNFVLQHPLGSLYHLNCWLDACESAYNHKVYRVIVEEQQRLVGYLPLTVIRPPFAKAKVVAVAFADYCAPLSLMPEVTNAIEQALKTLMAELGVQQVEIRTSAQQPFEDEPLAVPDTLTPSASAAVALSTAKVRMIVTLPTDANTLLASYKPKLRSQIKKAAKNGLVFQRATELSALKDFYQIYCTNMHRLGSPAHSLPWFEQLVSRINGEQQFFVALIYCGEQAVGAALVFYFQHRAWIPWASTLAQFNHLAPNMLMYWEIQAYLADHGVTEFDMGRSSLGEGTFRFKQQWGARPYLLDWQCHKLYGQCQPTSNTASDNKLRQLAETIWQRLPLGVATFLGSRIRGYIPL